MTGADVDRPDVVAFSKLYTFATTELLNWSEPAVEAFLDHERVLYEWEQEGLIAYHTYGYRDSDGNRAVDIFLQERGHMLTLRQRQALVALQGAWVSLFEIERVELDVGLTLLDIVSGGHIEVSERLGTHSMKTGHVILAWLKTIDGRTALGAACSVPLPHVESVLRELNRGMDSARKATPLASRQEWIVAALPAAHRKLRQAVRDWVPPTPVSDDGQELAIHQSVYEAPDPAAVRRALLNQSDVKLVDDDHFLVASQPLRIGGTESCHLVQVELRTVRLTVTAPTEPLLRDGCKRLERILGRRVRHRSDSKLTVAEMAETEARFACDGPAQPRNERVLGVQGDRHEIPAMAHEVMGRLVPNLAHDTNEVARSLRTRSGWEKRPIDREDIAHNTVFIRSSKMHVKRLVQAGQDIEYAFDDADYLASHFFYMANHELHLRKTFFVDEAMAWMLANTSLDIDGAMLKLPFPCCALVFTDPYTLELGASLLRDVHDISEARKHPTIISVYVIQGPEVDGARGLYVYVLFDAQTGHWPYLVNRDLLVRDDDDLEAVVESRFADADIPDRDPLFEAPELKKLLHLVVSAILYATSAHADTISIVKGAGSGGKKKSKAKKPAVLLARSQDDVYHLPGTIDIERVRKMREFAATGEGRAVLKRFMVRGHWRRALMSWKDQRARWIEPYWKGPDVAAIIERAYRLKG